LFETLVVWLTETIFRLGYPGILILMALESSFFPFPSEVVLPPGGYLAAQGRMNGVLVLASGVAGSLLGAVVNYVLAVRLGRPLLHRYSKYLLIKESSLDKSEAFFRRHGEFSTFIGRLIPVIRQYISLPAGLARMNLPKFSAYTALGAGIWCAILTYIGWYLGRHGDRLLQEDVSRYTTLTTLVLAPLLVIAIIVYVLIRRRRAVDTQRPESESQ
jgi:membrane protein DedA with SNARE-associated domain